MKELTIKEKAQRYDEAIERGKRMFSEKELNYLFPELVESEDERIREALCKAIWNYIPYEKAQEYIAWLEKLKVFAEHGDGLYYFGNNGFTYVDNPTCDNVSWIEKQGEQKPTLPKWKYKKDDAPLSRDSLILNKYGCVVKAVSGALVSDAWVLDYDELAKLPKEEKVDNANKVEPNYKPKFNIDDWVVWENQYYKVNYNGCGYELVDQNGLKTSLEYGTIDESAHLWDITKDAKDGDVLYSLDSNQPFIYQKRNVHEQATAYCGINKYGKFFVWNTKDCIIALDKYVPATKEQRDALFVEMEKAGYIFDFDKKELKEIEQKSVWSEEDEKNCLGIIDEIAVNKSEAPESDYKTYDRFIDWLKSLKDRVGCEANCTTTKEWSEEDIKALNRISTILVDASEVKNWWKEYRLIEREEMKRLTDFLKSLKDRVQPQKQWKPSDEQIDAFEHFVKSIGESGFAYPHNHNTKCVYSLLNDLKKL